MLGEFREVNACKICLHVTFMSYISNVKEKKTLSGYLDGTMIKLEKVQRNGLYKQNHITTLEKHKQLK